MSWAAAAGAIASVAGSQMGNSANAASSQKQMDFQKYMSDTAHQREVRDLRKAGLNPILAANSSGASTPGGASYTSESLTSKIDPMTAHNLQQSKATTDNIKTDTGLKAANTKSAEKSLEIADQTKKLLQAQTAKEEQNAVQAAQQAKLTDKYGDANNIMGLIGSGTGAIGNLMSVPQMLKNILRPNTHTTTERYSPQGEHMGSTHTRSSREK
jgi:hypothetical protein